MINPHTKTGEDLAHVVEHLTTWPMNTDFVHVQSGVIHMIEGGSSLAVSYISREQWAAAKSLHQYWFPEKQPKPEGFCDVCGDTHCIHELSPGICAEYDDGSVPLDLAKAIYNGDFRPGNAEDSGMKNSDQVKQWGVAEDEFLAPEIGMVENFMGSPFSTLEEDEEWERIQQKQESLGGDNDYWIARIDSPKRLEPYSAECEDLIELFQMTFQEGEAFKALWRKGQMRIGNGKPGDTLLRNSEKVYHFGGRMVAMELGR